MTESPFTIVTDPDGTHRVVWPEGTTRNATDVEVTLWKNLETSRSLMVKGVLDHYRVSGFSREQAETAAVVCFHSQENFKSVADIETLDAIVREAFPKVETMLLLERGLNLSLVSQEQFRHAAAVIICSPKAQWSPARIEDVLEPLRKAIQSVGVEDPDRRLPVLFLEGTTSLECLTTEGKQFLLDSLTANLGGVYRATNESRNQSSASDEV